jgi:hypothetical protein
MAIGKYLSLEEARNKKQFKRFAKEHPSKGKKKDFDDLLGRMLNTMSSKPRAKRND